MRARGRHRNFIRYVTFALGSLWNNCGAFWNLWRSLGITSFQMEAHENEERRDRLAFLRISLSFSTLTPNAMCQQPLKRFYHSKGANVRLNLKDLKSQFQVSVRAAFPHCRFYSCPCTKNYAVSSMRISSRNPFFFCQNIFRRSSRRIFSFSEWHPRTRWFSPDTLGLANQSLGNVALFCKNV